MEKTRRSQRTLALPKLPPKGSPNRTRVIVGSAVALILIVGCACVLIAGGYAFAAGLIAP